MGECHPSSHFDPVINVLSTFQCTDGAAAITALSTQLAQMFIGSAEYGLLAKIDAEFIEDLYDAILRRGSDTAGFNFWLNYLSTSTRPQVLQLFTASPEYQLRVQNVINARCLP